MRKSQPIVLFLFLFTEAVLAADSLEIAGRLAKNGAPQLALAAVERDQPKDDQLERWFRWEPLHLSLLNELNRPAEVLQRIKASPAGAPAEIQPQVWQQGAQAAIKQGQGMQARDFLSRMLWQSDLDGPQYIEVRRMIAQSYLPDKADMAYRVMLRYSQDFQPIRTSDAVVFTEGMLSAGGKEEAGTWVTTLDGLPALQLRARLASGLVSPEQAIAEARNALNSVPAQATSTLKLPAQKKNADPVATNSSAGFVSNTDSPGYWKAVLQAAIMQKDLSVQIEAHERLLNESSLTADAAELWPRYFDLALQEGNRAHLLRGEDKAWLNLARDMAVGSPLSARALFAYLAIHAADPEVRSDAQAHLADQLLSAGLDIAAVRLFAGGGSIKADVLMAKARYVLGKAATQAGLYRHAARFWSGIAQPADDMPPDQWAFRRAQAFVYGGAYREAVEAASRLPLPETIEQRTLLLALGELADGKGENLPAAGYYLQSAGPSEDSLAQKARWSAARVLERAGLNQDARKQYLILQDTIQDADSRIAIRQALGRL